MDRGTSVARMQVGNAETAMKQEQEYIRIAEEAEWTTRQSVANARRL